MNLEDQFLEDQFLKELEFLDRHQQSVDDGAISALRSLISAGWDHLYVPVFGEQSIDGLAPHHIEAIEWHWESRIDLLEGRKPTYDAYFPIWSRGHNKCLDEFSEILMADGTRKPIRDVQKGDWVQSFDEATGKIVLQPVLNQWYVGKKKCVKLKTRTGWELVGTPDHKVRTFDGWKTIGELLPTDRIASPRQTVTSKTPYPVKDEEIRLVTYFLAEGCTTAYGQGIACKAVITNADPSIVADVQYCGDVVGFQSRKSAGLYNTSFTGGVCEWLRGHGLARKTALTKRLPDWMFKLTSEQIQHALAAWFDTDGYISTQVAGITLANAAMVDDLRYLFLQFGVITKRYYLHNEFAGSWAITADQTGHDQLRQLPYKLKGEHWDRINSTFRYSLIDTYPQSVTANLPKGMNRMLRRAIGWKPSYTNPTITRNKLQRAMAVQTTPLWDWLEQADVFWDEVVSIEETHDRETYDLEIKNTHNFIANGLVTHNSGIARRLAIIDGLLSYAYKQPGYALYLSRNKEMALKHSKSIETLLQSRRTQAICSALATEQVNEQKRSKGWTAKFIYTAANIIYHFAGLDEGLAGGNLETNVEADSEDRADVRVTFFVLDDIDGREDSPVIGESRLNTLTNEVLPMGQHNTLAFFPENLISRFSTMYRIQSQQVRILTGRKPTEPIPAVLDFKSEQVITADGIIQDRFVSGIPTWNAWDAERIQLEINRFGLPAFRRECLHEVEQAKEGLVLYNYDDDVHVISESEFAAIYGTRDAWLGWRKKPGNDWARTKTDKHANVAGWLAVSSQDSELPNFTFLMHPMSFPADSAPEDVAERLLSCLDPVAYESQGRKVTWGDLRKEILRRLHADSHTKTVAEKIAYERGELSRLIPKYTIPLLRRCNVQQGDMSHEADTVRRIYTAIYGLGMKPVNPKRLGGIELINREMQVDYEAEHPFREGQMGYTQWFMVVPDDKSRPYQRKDGRDVYLPKLYPKAIQTKDLHDDDLCRFQISNCRYKETSLTASGESGDAILKLYDDYVNLLQMFAIGSSLKGVPMTREQKVQMLIPQRVTESLRTAQKAGDRLTAALNYEFSRDIAEKTLDPKSDDLWSILE